MGSIYINRPQFLMGNAKDAKLHKLMFIKKGGRATSGSGEYDLSRDYLDAELICISNEDEYNWIGNYAEGMGFLMFILQKKIAETQPMKKLMNG